MAETNKYNSLSIAILILIFTGCLLFFGVIFRYHIFFIEQLQLFLLTYDHFAGYLAKPAFLSSYSGDFLTQFYWLNRGGAVIITITLALLWMGVNRLVKKISKTDAPFFLSMIPVIFSWIALCNPEYALSNVISIIISVLFTLIYISVRSSRARTLYGIISVVLLYIIAGSSYWIFTVVAIIYEIFRGESRPAIPGKIINSVVLLAIAIFIPLGLKNQYLLTAGQAFTYMSEMTKNPGLRQFIPMIAVVITALATLIPWKKAGEKIHSAYSLLIQSIILIGILVPGILLTADFTLEKILRLDYEAHNNRWNRVYELSGKYDLRNNISAYYTNIALSKLGLMPEKLMEHYQPAATGLFIPVNANENYLTITLSNEVYWQLGDVNASQHSALLGTIFSPRAQNSRLMKRLVEINIINGEYAVAGKYIKILENTMFHSKWASDRKKFLCNEDECNRSGWIAEKRAIIPVRDMLKGGNEYIATLRMLADNHPDNRMAVDYLLCYHLLSKEIPSFARDFEKYYSPWNKRVLPRVYQEGLLIFIAGGKVDMETLKKYIFSPEVIRDFTDYTKIYEENLGKGASLQEKYGKTYWFYFHYAEMKEQE